MWEFELKQKLKSLSSYERLKTKIPENQDTKSRQHTAWLLGRALPQLQFGDLQSFNGKHSAQGED